jgi:hypothetical protein
VNPPEELWIVQWEMRSVSRWITVDQVFEHEADAITATANLAGANFRVIRYVPAPEDKP